MFQLVTSGNKSVRQWFPMISKYGDESKKKISMKVVHGKERTSWHQADMSYKKYKAQIPVNIIYLILKFQYSKPARFPTEFGAVTVFATRRTTSLSKLSINEKTEKSSTLMATTNKQFYLLASIFSLPWVCCPVPRRSRRLDRVFSSRGRPPARPRRPDQPAGTRWCWRRRSEN